MSIELFYLIGGLLVLWLGSELIVNGTLSIARHYKISELFLGLVVIAFCTDLPELAINIDAAIQKVSGIETSGLIIGDIIGSTIAQISIVLGIVVLVGFVSIKKKNLIRDGLVLIGSVILLFLFTRDGIFEYKEGLCFIFIYLAYLVLLFKKEKIYDKLIRAKKMHLAWAVSSFLAGAVILIFGSKIVVDNGVILATNWGISQTIIGITLVGLGTSLPELAVSISAVKKGAHSLAIGNLIGSNIYDILFVLGVSGVISGFNIETSSIFFDIPVLLILSLLVVLFLRNKLKITKKEAIILIAFYIVYIVVKLMFFR